MSGENRRFFVWLAKLKEHPGSWLLTTAVPAVLGMLGVGISVLGFVHTWQTSHNLTFGTCQLAPPTSATVAGLNDYIHQGQMYANRQQYSQAAAKFELVVDKDPHYLGAHQDLGVTQMEEGHFQDAIRSFQQEVTLIECLRSVPYEQLYNFAYFVNKEELRTDQKNAAVKERLDKAEDTVNYNLACALAKEGETQNALDELKKAASNQSIRRSVVNADRDLDSVRNSPGFGSALNQFPQ